MGSENGKIFNINNEDEIISDKSSDNNSIGNKFSDFEIIKFYDFSGNEINFSWSLAKVRSLINKKLYLMKKINNPFEHQIMQMYQNQFQNLTKIDNPFIMKYYSLFQDNDNNIYLIYEYMDTELGKFLEINRLNNSIINEEEIWNILLQSLLGLRYLHQNYSYLGISLTNIFINDERNVKIGIFNEFQNNNNINYNINDDIIFLGDYFSQLLINNYSQELIQIINLITNINQIPDLNFLYQRVVKIYITKFAKNTSILSVIQCLFSCQKFYEIIFQNRDLINQNMQIYNMCYWYLKIINNINDKSNLNECIEEFRLEISSKYKYTKFGENKEINPFHLLIFILEKIFAETNVIDSKNCQDENNKEKYIVNSVFNAEKIDKYNKGQMLKKFEENFSQNTNSIISNLFCGIILTETKCLKCENIQYSFSNFCFLYYDISDTNKNEFDLIKDGFNNNKLLYVDKNIYCEKCLTYQKHSENDKYYRMSKNLIIYFDRGNNYKNNSIINFDENLNLSYFIEDKNNSPKEYYLIGSINRIINNNKEEFIYYTRDQNQNNIWHISNINVSLNFSFAPINKIKSNGQTILLFYNMKG